MHVCTLYDTYFLDVRWWPQKRFSVKNFKKSRAKIPRVAAALVDWYTIHKVGFNYVLTIKCQFAILWTNELS